MGVGKIINPYKTDAGHVEQLGAGQPEIQELLQDQEGRVLLDFMSQEGPCSVNHSDSEQKVKIVTYEASKDFNPNWYESGKMNHGMGFIIVIPKGLSKEEAVKQLKEAVRSDEVLRWQLATYISGLSYMETMEVTADGSAYTNACHAEAVATERWINFSKWLWNDPLDENTEWRLKELVMQDIGVAADRSLVRYNSDDTVFTSGLKNPLKMLGQGMSAFKDKDATEVGPLEFVRLNKTGDKRYERVGLPAYKLHPASSQVADGTNHGNMATTCYQGDFHDLSSEDTNLFHHGIGYIPFTWQMIRFAGSEKLGETLVKKQIGIYESESEKADRHVGIARSRGGGLNHFYVHADTRTSSTNPDGDYVNSNFMLEGAMNVYNGQISLDDLPDYLESRCSCSPEAAAEAVYPRPETKKNDEGVPYWRTSLPKVDNTIEGITRDVCKLTKPNTYESDRMIGKSFELNDNPKVRDLVEEWKVERDPRQRLRLIREAQKFAPKDVALRLLYIGTAFDIIESSKGGAWPFSEKETEEIVSMVESLNMVARPSDLKDIWQTYFKGKPYPKVLEEYHEWSEKTCFKEGICGNPLLEFLDRKYEYVCRHAEYVKKGGKTNDIKLPLDTAKYKNVSIEKSTGTLSFEFQDENGIWHRCKYVCYGHSVGNYLVVDGREVVASFEQDTVLHNKFIFESEDYKWLARPNQWSNDSRFPIYIANMVNYATPTEKAEAVEKLGCVIDALEGKGLFDPDFYAVAIDALTKVMIEYAASDPALVILAIQRVDNLLKSGADIRSAEASMAYNKYLETIKEFAHPTDEFTRLMYEESGVSAAAQKVL